MGAQLTLDPLEAYGVLIVIISVSALTFYGLRAFSARRQRRAPTRAIPPT